MRPGPKRPINSTEDVVGVTVLIIIVIVVFSFFYLTANSGKDALDKHNSDEALLSKLRYGQVYKVKSGFYTGCEARLDERKSFWTFNAYIRCGDKGSPGFEEINAEHLDIESAK